MKKKILLTDIKKVYSEFGISIHDGTYSQSTVNRLIKEIIMLRECGPVAKRLRPGNLNPSDVSSNLTRIIKSKYRGDVI